MEQISHAAMMHRHLIPVPIPVCKKDAKRSRYQPEWVLLPHVKVMIAPHGVREPKQVLKATEVASQISAKMILSHPRIRTVVHWRMATYYALCDLFPNMSRNKASKVMQRDRSTLAHYDRKRAANPDFLADKVKAIKEVLV